MLNFLEKRNAARFPVGKQASIFINEQEKECIVKDVSETGISFLISSNITEQIFIGSEFKFQFIDDEQIISGSCIIVRIQEFPYETLIGCKLIDDKIVRLYAGEKEVKYYLNIIKNNA